MSQFYTELVTILKRSSTSISDTGEILNIYTSYVDIYGSFQNLNGIWDIKEGVMNHYKTPMFYCAYTTQIEEEDALQYNSKNYIIENVGNAWGDHLEIKLKIGGSI